jgi:ATP-binding cassette, subfamily B, bacterial
VHTRGRFADRKEIGFFQALAKASRRYSSAWWTLLLVRGLLPTAISLSFGWLVSAVTTDSSLAAPLTVFGIAFTALVMLHPIHQMVSMNLGSMLSAYLYDRLMAAGVSPSGIGHLERSELNSDLTMARDFDQGILGPPLAISMDFITGGLLDLVIGVSAACVLFAFRWWAPFPILIGWFLTHWLLRESGVWKDRNTDEVRTAQRHAEYAYRLAVDATPAKELRFFGLAGWVTERFISTRKKLADMQYEATRLRERSMFTCVVATVATNVFVVWKIVDASLSRELGLGRVVIFAQAVVGASAVAFGGLNWALDGASAPVAALRRLEVSMAAAGALPRGEGTSRAPETAPEIAFRDVSFAYDAESGRRVLDGFNLTIPAGTSMAIVGQNGAGKTTLAKLVCRLYDPADGSIEVNGQPLSEIDVASWRSKVTAVFQDFVRFELSLRANVAPKGSSDEVVKATLLDAGGEALADGDLDTILSKGYPGGTDLSGGQWQRVALARALCAVREGANVVLLDEPTAQLDVRGEAEIFERVLRATKGCTVILVSHRFSTVRLADRICVMEAGRVVELGSHDELIELDGKYKMMFELQASRFTNDVAETGAELDADGKEVVHETL